jgi:hypothetical protein
MSPVTPAQTAELLSCLLRGLLFQSVKQLPRRFSLNQLITCHESLLKGRKKNPGRSLSLQRPGRRIHMTGLVPSSGLVFWGRDVRQVGGFRGVRCNCAQTRVPRYLIPACKNTESIVPYPTHAPPPPNYLFSHPPQHFLTKSGLVAEPEPRIRRSEHLPEPR